MVDIFKFIYQTLTEMCYISLVVSPYFLTHEIHFTLPLFLHIKRILTGWLEIVNAYIVAQRQLLVLTMVLVSSH